MVYSFIQDIDRKDLTFVPMTSFRVPAVHILFAVLMLAVSARYLVFQSYISSQKQRYRIMALRNAGSIKTIEMDTFQLNKNAAGFVWKDNCKELVIKGVYHEVLKVNKRGGRAIVYLVEDSEENRLFSHFFIKTRNSENTLLLKNIVSLIFIIPDVQILAVKGTSETYNSFKRVAVKKGFREQVHAPPEGVI